MSIEVNGTTCWTDWETVPTNTVNPPELLCSARLCGYDVADGDDDQRAQDLGSGLAPRPPAWCRCRGNRAARGATTAPQRRRADLCRVVLDRSFDRRIAPPGPRQGRAGALIFRHRRFNLPLYRTPHPERECHGRGSIGPLRRPKTRVVKGIRRRAERGGVAAQAFSRTVPSVARARYRTRRFEPARQGVRGWHLPLCWLRPTAVRLRRQV